MIRKLGIEISGGFELVMQRGRRSMSMPWQKRQSENQILLEVCSSGIAVITLNRPKALNAFTTDMLIRLAELF